MSKPKDMKEALTSTRKPDVTHVRYPLMVYVARACEYGNAKGYERANSLRRTPGLAEDFERLRSYARAAVSHLMKMLDSMEQHQASDFHLTNVEGMRTACYSPDTDEMPGAKVGASRLPHIAHAAASLNIAITQAVNSGLLPEDPGQPWVEENRTGFDKYLEQRLDAPDFADAFTREYHSLTQADRAKCTCKECVYNDR